MPPARKRTRTYDPAKIRVAVLAQFGNVRQGVLTLTEEQLARPTHLGDWSVRELAAHLTMAVETVSRNLDRPEPSRCWSGRSRRRHAPGTSPTAPANSPTTIPTSTRSTRASNSGSPSAWPRPPTTGCSTRAPVR
jgi:hypothetical protein